MDRQRFEKIVRNKCVIGEPFTLEDVAETGKCQHPAMPPCECKPTPVPTAWMTAMVQAGTVRKIGERPSTNPAARGRKVSLWSGAAPRVEEEPDLEVA